MKEEIAYSKPLYKKMMKTKKGAYGVLILVIVVCFIILRIIYLRMPEIIAQNQLLVGFPVLMLVVSLIISTAQVFTEKIKAQYSGLIWDEGKLQYIYLLSNETREYYRKFVVETIDCLEEKKTHFLITGKIDCVDFSASDIKPRTVKSVRIPKYFEGLESVLNEMIDAGKEAD